MAKLIRSERLEEKYDIADPNPAALIEALRAFGYSVETAIADLIDNSITAAAKNVWLTFFWNGTDSYISVRDDGQGMSARDLINAMRPGSKNPLEDRDPDDLGRFGLGLKTASFSQCRRLTVLSRKTGSRPAIRRWDLDYVNESGEWRLLRDAAPGSEPRLQLAPKQNYGTVVLWEVMDRLVEDFDVEHVPAQRRFLEMASGVERHVSMVFHRFLRGGKLKIWIEGRKVDPWDPFLSDEKATQQLGTEQLTLRGQTVSVRPFVLPHHSKISTEAHAVAAGPRGWNAQQGFYIYRNERLLVPGDWMGLGFQKEEHYKLARIQINLTNAMDHDWHIDVRKSRARPPGALREDFRRIAKVTRERAVEIYRHRGKVIARKHADPYTYVWMQKVKHGRVSYKLNRDHPLVKEVAAASSPDLAPKIKAMLRLLEETIPVPLIAVSTSENPDQQSLPFEDAPTKDVVNVMVQVYRALRNSGLSHTKAKQRVAQMEPFQHYPELIEDLEEQRR